jgi:hypothetical protein
VFLSSDDDTDSIKFDGKYVQAHHAAINMCMGYDVVSPDGID